MTTSESHGAISGSRVSEEIARELRNYANVLTNLGASRPEHVDRIKTLAAMALRSEPSEPVAWQPIETAPKDGSLVMLCLYPHPGFVECPRKVGGWWYEKWNIFGASWLPTHWQPLPASPQPGASS